MTAGQSAADYIIRGTACGGFLVMAGQNAEADSRSADDNRGSKGVNREELR